MATEDKVIRDFIYVDVERLYSLYSQVFEGVADQIIQSYMDASTTTDTQKESLLKGGSIEAQVAEMSRRTENKFLYDHMYNLFEGKVRGAILESPSATTANFREVIGQAFLIKVSGAAEIEDYTRLNIVMSKFNEVGEAIAYASVLAEEELSKAISQLQETVEQIPDRNTKAKAKERFGKQTDKSRLAKQHAKEVGLHQDEQNVKNLNLISELFYPEGFDVTVTPNDGDGSIVYRGVLDKKWLRVQPNLLRALYGGYVESKWTMVGQVTYLPGGQLPTNEDSPSVVEGDESPSMRNPYRNMFRAARVVERMFLESKGRIDVVVSPLAIYHEMPFPLPSNK
jgi:hypothetical protein